MKEEKENIKCYFKQKEKLDRVLQEKKIFTRIEDW